MIWIGFASLAIGGLALFGMWVLAHAIGGDL